MGEGRGVGGVEEWERGGVEEWGGEGCGSVEEWERGGVEEWGGGGVEEWEGGGKKWSTLTFLNRFWHATCCLKYNEK